MKLTALILLLCSFCFSQTSISTVQGNGTLVLSAGSSDKLVATQKLTDSEIKQLKEASDKLNAAQRNYDNLRQRVTRTYEEADEFIAKADADAHNKFSIGGCAKYHYEIDGDFILKREYGDNSPCYVQWYGPVILGEKPISYGDTH